MLSAQQRCSTVCILIEKPRQRADARDPGLLPFGFPTLVLRFACEHIGRILGHRPSCLTAGSVRPLKTPTFSMRKQVWNALAVVQPSRDRDPALEGLCMCVCVRLLETSLLSEFPKLHAARNRARKSSSLASCASLALAALF